MQAGISKRELFDDYYFDEIYSVLEKRIELEGGRTQQVEVDDFF